MSDGRQLWLSELETVLADLSARGRRRLLRSVRLLPHHRTEIDGRTYLNLASNDYLGFGCDEQLARQFLQTAVQETAASSCACFTASASRLLSGEHRGLQELECQLAAAYGYDCEALLFNSGYHANIGILPAVTSRDDLILSDRLVHASLLDGIRLCRAQWTRFRHNDMSHLKDLLAREAAPKRRVFVVTESVFSMDGDVADLRTLVELKQRYGVILYVDEAHAVGVRGRQGLGLAAELELAQDIDILVGTFGKALAASGAYAIVPRPLRDYLINTCRSFIYTTALPPIHVWWMAFVLDRVFQADDRRESLRRRVSVFRQALGAGDGTHIVPLTIGEDGAALKLAHELRELGFWVPAIRPPTVPEGTARLRFSLGAGMDESELQRVAAHALQLRESW